MPSRLRNTDDDKTFGATFKDAHICVTHFIEVYDYSVLNDGLIVALAVRGIGIVGSHVMSVDGLRNSSWYIVCHHT